MRNEEIRERAKRFCIENGVTSYPVEIVKICNNLGLKVFEAYLKPNESGMIVVDDKKWKEYDTDKFIIVNITETPVRRRFTIAHELAHYILHKQDSLLYAHRDYSENTQIKERIETEADYFAANVLMPEELVRECVEDIKERHGGKILNLVLINEISRMFYVSETAARVRLQQLKMI